MPPEPPPARDARIVVPSGPGHFLSTSCVLCLPLLFLVWRQDLDVSCATLGFSVTPMPLSRLIDMGHPGLLLPVVAGLLGLSLLRADRAQGAARAPEAFPAA